MRSIPGWWLPTLEGDVLYFSVSLIKFLEGRGSYLLILLAVILMAVMLVRHYTTIKKYEFNLHNKVTLEWFLTLGDKLGMVWLSSN